MGHLTRRDPDFPPTIALFTYKCTTDVGPPLRGRPMDTYRTTAFNYFHTDAKFKEALKRFACAPPDSQQGPESHPNSQQGPQQRASSQRRASRVPTWLEAAADRVLWRKVCDAIVCPE